ncbi:Asp/Glu/hydantoin racemase [Aspergillus pseudotamarii]|uniref:Asp/Glu/hydantoin racemase n=1 Tax=Aspergillus pseudotamarii TaxID=132259 RepID=A0A5N6T4V0_ASPPS|nr:Asp/Glu/hydantoin racemase [Aspergillus pseudotamarii]KAE8141338.1 Asp/Glu/hydantoin racemase [Aspergillus pseudotamarii]
MKTIGIIGGMGWPSTITYYRTINELIAKRIGGTGGKSGRWGKVADTLAIQIDKLQSAGADFFILTCNTVHFVAPHLGSSMKLPMLHIADATARKIVDGGYKTVGLLGSRRTMTGDHYIKRLASQHDFNLLVPHGSEQDKVCDAIMGELVQGTFLAETRAQFKLIVAGLAKRGAEVIILGCTEIGILVQAEDSPVPLIDTSIARAEAAVDMALAD